MKIVISIILLNFCLFKTVNGNVDSVLNTIENSTYHDTAKFSVLIKYLIDEFDNIQVFDSTQQPFFDKLELLINSSNSNYLKGRAYNYIGLYQKSQGLYNESIRSYTRAINVYGPNAAPKRIAGALINTGSAYLSMYDYKSARQYLLKGMQVCEEHEINDFLNNAISWLALTYLSTKEYKKAKVLIQTNLDYLKSTNKNFGYLVAKINLAEACNGLNEFNKAISICNIAKLKLQALKFEPLMAFFYHQLAKGHEGLNNLDSAKFFYQKAIGLHNGNYRTDNKNYIQIDYAEFLIENNEPKQAISICEFEFKVSDSLNFLESSGKCSECLYSAYKKLGDDSKALFYFEQKQFWADSLRKLDATNQLYQLSLKRQLTKDSLERVKMLELRELEAAKEKAIKTRKNRIQYSLVVIIVLLLATAIAIFTKLKISPRLASGLIFIFFILTFEFFLVVLDPWVDSISDGEVGWKIGINTAIALVLFGIHQVSEKRLRTALINSDK
ncbi:MAG: hypothetical protein JXQ87_19060 [Bacteroidia bacterium]